MESLIKVTLEFSDEIRQLEGEKANKWFEELNSICVFAAVHGEHLSNFNWTITKKVPDTAGNQKN